MIGRKRRVKRLFLRYSLSIWKLFLLFQCFRQSHVPTLWCDFYSCFRINWFLKIGFSPKARGFYPFGDATALAGEGGVRGVGWLIQASAWNQTCHSANDRCEALASPKGCFFLFLFLPPSIYPLNRKITKFLIQSLSLFTQNKRRLNPNQSPFLLPFVEMEGIEPSSKRGTNKLSTCLVLTWFSSIGRIKTTNLKLIL